MTNLHKVNEISRMIKNYENAQAKWSGLVRDYYNAQKHEANVAKRIARNLGISLNEVFDPNFGTMIHPVIGSHNNYIRASNNSTRAYRNMNNRHRVAAVRARNQLVRRLGLRGYPLDNELRAAINNWRSKIPMFQAFAHVLTTRGNVQTGRTARRLTPNEIGMILRRAL